MDTYQLLRMIDYLKASVDNLMTETMFLLPPVTCGRGTVDKGVSPEDVCSLIGRQRDRIDSISKLICEYRKAKRF